MPVCQCLLKWSHAFGTVYIWFVLLHHTGVNCALPGPPGKRSIKKITFLVFTCCFCGVYNGNDLLKLLGICSLSWNGFI